MKKNEKNVSAPAGKKRLLWLPVVLIVVAIAAIFLGWYLNRYQFYAEHEQYIAEPEAALPGSEFTGLEDAEPSVAGMKLAASNDNLKLYANEKTGEVAVYDKRTGQTVYSNPPEADSDAIANKTNKGYLKSQFLVEYYNAGLTTNTYDSFSKCVELGNIAAEAIDGGVRFIYEVGDEVDIFYIPHLLSDERFNELYEGAPDNVKKLMKGQENSFYIQDPETGNWVIGEYGETMSARNRNRISNSFVEQGMTEEEYFDWMEKAGVEGAETLGFTITLEWKLLEDGVQCTVPADRIEERGGGRVGRIQLLPFMGAASTDETGYMVVPNGSGSLIRFNNGKTNTSAYNQYIYDMDLVDAEYNKTQNVQPIRLPIFAICREDSTILASIEKGSSLALLTADISGRSHTYNNVYATFVLRGDEKLSMFGAGEMADMPIVENDLYPETLTVRYTLLGEDYTGYSGVARAYRERLIADGVLTPKAEGGDIPFYYDVIGGVKETAHTMGIQHLRVAPMTTFEQAGTMAGQLASAGVGNQVMNFKGWMNGGYYHDVVDKIKVLRQLGGKDDLEKLSNAMATLGGEFYADAAIQNVSLVSKRYRSTSESSRYYGAGYAVSFGEVNPATLRRTSSLGYKENLYDLLSPRFLPYYVGHYIEAMEDIDVSGLSLRDMGSELHADKKRSNLINREEALMVTEAMMDQFQATGKDLMIAGGNGYALEGVKHVVGVPMSATEYFIVDETIPLYQMVTHGCVDYAGMPINTLTTQNEREELLKLVEYGASTRYIFTWEEATEMKYTGLNKFYATTFDAWMDEAVENYNYVNGALSAVSNAQIQEHCSLSATLKKVTYDNGTVIYINYGDEAAEADGVTIPADDYVVKGGVE